MTRLSELEGAVLGLLWSDGPLTAYAIRTRFLKSRSSHFSGSSGAIYPLVERAALAGFVEPTTTMRGKRTSKSYAITAAGRRALRHWLTPVEDWMAAVEFDPIRIRVHFLGALSAGKRDRFLEETVGQLRDEIKATRALIEELAGENDEWKVWGARGALSVLNARLEWIEEIRVTLD